MPPETPRYTASTGGRFVSRGRGRHPARTIDSFELIHVADGVLGIAEDGHDYRVQAGERLLLRPGLRHGGTLAYPPDLVFFWLHFYPANRAARRALADMPTHAPAASPELAGAYCRLFLAEQRLLRQGLTHKSALLDGLAGILLAEAGAPLSPVSASEDGAFGLSPSARHLAEAAERFIRLRYAEPVSTFDIARHLGCHPDYLGRVYRAVYSRTPGEALRAARLGEACRLLESTNLSVKEIALASGYRDVSYFRKQFHRENAATPAQYRRWRTSGYVNTE